jgi:hypothetical protein
MEVSNLLQLRGLQIEHFIENASNLVESWFLNMIFGTLCVMGPKMDWSFYLHHKDTNRNIFIL